MKRTEYTLELDGIDLHVVRKDVKHVRISIRPPHGEVRVSAPRHVSERALRRLLLPKLPWIRRKQTEINARGVQLQPEFVTGEVHHFRGQGYRLVVHEGETSEVRLAGETIEMRVPVGADRQKRGAVLERWHRRQLCERVQPLRESWEARLGVKAAEVRIRRMKTRWGSCNTRARRVWLNLELVKRSDDCLEYVLVHELVHLLEGSHGPRFWRLMDEHMPGWQQHRQALKATL